jgi:hypothetical protein
LLCFCFLGGPGTGPGNEMQLFIEGRSLKFWIFRAPKKQKKAQKKGCFWVPEMFFWVPEMFGFPDNNGIIFHDGKRTKWYDHFRFFFGPKMFSFPDNNVIIFHDGKRTKWYDHFRFFMGPRNVQFSW